MASSPAPLPNLGLLDGLGAAPSGATDSPAPLPSLALLGGLGAAAGASTELPYVWQEPVPAAFFADIGFQAIYAWMPLGIPVNARDEVAETSANQGGDPAFLPHIGLLLAPGGSPPAPEPTRSTAAGRSSRKRRVVVEIDGEKFIVESEEEAEALLDQAKAEAEKLAQVAIERAVRAEKRAPKKVIKDAQKALVVPQIKAPGLEGYASDVLRQIRESYASAMQTIEVSALLRKREREEEDDEDVLMLIA